MRAGRSRDGVAALFRVAKRRSTTFRPTMALRRIFVSPPIGPSLVSSRLVSYRLVSFLGAADPVRARVMSARGEKNFRDGVLSLSLSLSLSFSLSPSISSVRSFSLGALFFSVKRRKKRKSVARSASHDSSSPTQLPRLTL